MRWLAIGRAVVAVIVLTSCGAPARKVVVPLRARETDLADAFGVLRAAGFRVAISRGTPISSLRSPGVASLAPHAGTEAAVGSTVTITPGGSPIGSPAPDLSHHYRVPSFSGKTLTAAVSWANAHRLFWSVSELPALRASAAAHLFDAYRVVRQQPEPGETIVAGRMIGHGFMVTPLTLTVAAR